MSKAKIYIGNAPCSWGTLEFEGMEDQRIEYEQMLDEVAATGYTGTELGDWGFMPTDTTKLKFELKKRQLTMTGAFVPVALKNPKAYAPGEATALRVARQLAAISNDVDADKKPFLVLADDNGMADPVRAKNAGRVTPEMSLSDSEWQTFAQGAERIARAVRDETGLLTVFHHHCAGYVETPNEVIRLMDLTDPEILGLVFDTGHYAFGAGVNGCNTVLDGLKHFADRIWYIHFKDFEPDIANLSKAEEWDYFTSIQHGVFCELGRGCVDFPCVVTWLQQQNYRGYITVEQDILPGMGSPQESAQRNRNYLKEIGL